MRAFRELVLLGVCSLISVSYPYICTQVGVIAGYMRGRDFHVARSGIRLG